MSVENYPVVVSKVLDGRVVESSVTSTVVMVDRVDEDILERFMSGEEVSSMSLNPGYVTLAHTCPIASVSKGNHMCCVSIVTVEDVLGVTVDHFRRAGSTIFLNYRNNDLVVRCTRNTRCRILTKEEFEQWVR